MTEGLRMSDRGRLPARTDVAGSPSIMKSLPLQRIPDRAVTAGDPGDAISPLRPKGFRSWVASLWGRYLGLTVSADPSLTTVWIHGQCLDVSIYDRDWPESYRY